MDMNTSIDWDASACYSAVMAKRIALVTGDYHKNLAEEMAAAARQELEGAGGELAADIRVAGSYEVPLAADALLARSDIDGVVALGYIEKGETLHGEVMGHVVFRALVDLQLKYKKPVGLGIIGPGATREQAEARKVGAATGAVRAALRNLDKL